MKPTSSIVRERILEVWVQPRARRNEILGYRDHVLRIRVTAPPVEGEANHLVKRVLAEALGIAPSKVEILKGDKGRRKKVRVVEVPLNNLERLEEVRGQEEDAGRSGAGVFRSAGTLDRSSRKIPPTREAKSPPKV